MDTAHIIMTIRGFNIQRNFQRKISIIYKKIFSKAIENYWCHLQKKQKNKKKYALESDSVTFLSNELSES